MIFTITSVSIKPVEYTFCIDKVSYFSTLQEGFERLYFVFIGNEDREISVSEADYIKLRESYQELLAPNKPPYSVTKA